MKETDAVAAIFADPHSAETAVKKLASAGFKMSNLSVVGKGYLTEENFVHFYNFDDRIKFWGKRGGLWDLFFGGLVMTVPRVGQVIVLGYLGSVTFSVVKSVTVVSELSVLGIALYDMGVPKDNVIQYEAALKAHNFLAMAHGTIDEVVRAKVILNAVNPTRLDLHSRLNATECDSFAV